MDSLLYLHYKVSFYSGTNKASLSVILRISLYDFVYLYLHHLIRNDTFCPFAFSRDFISLNIDSEHAIRLELLLSTINVLFSIPRVTKA